MFHTLSLPKFKKKSHFGDKARVNAKHFTQTVFTPVEAQTSTSGANKCEPATDRCKVIRNLISRPMRSVCVQTYYVACL